MTEFASLFGGGGLADVGAMAARCVPIWTVEYDAKIAEWHCKNIPGEVVVAAVEDVDPASLPVPDILWASPSCKRASVANMQGESAEDSSAAEAVCRFLRVMRPKGFILENVRGYRTFAAMNLIRAALTGCGYWWDETVQNAASFGVPQTRHRFILRAVLGGFLPPYPSPLPWVGWYAAIEDLIPTLPPSQFAPWQLQRLPDHFPGEFLHMTANTNKEHPTGTGVLECSRDANTVSSADGARPRAFLTDGGRNASRETTLRTSDEPAMGIGASAFRRKASVPRAFLVDGKPANFAGELCVVGADGSAPTLTASQEKHPFRAFLHGQGTRSAAGTAALPADTVTSNSNQTGVRAWLSSGRVVAMTPRALARFMSLPDWYELPPKNRLAVTIIGNGVACKLAEAIVRTVMEAIQ